MITIIQKYSYLACGPRVACRVCGKTVTAQVKESGIPYYNVWQPANRVVVALCSMSHFLTTTVFETLRNPLLRNLTDKNRQQRLIPLRPGPRNVVAGGAGS